MDLAERRCTRPAATSQSSDGDDGSYTFASACSWEERGGHGEGAPTPPPTSRGAATAPEPPQRAALGSVPQVPLLSEMRSCTASPSRNSGSNVTVSNHGRREHTPQATRQRLSPGHDVSLSLSGPALQTLTSYSHVGAGSWHAEGRANNVSDSGRSPMTNPSHQEVSVPAALSHEFGDAAPGWSSPSVWYQWGLQALRQGNSQANEVGTPAVANSPGSRASTRIELVPAGWSLPLPSGCALQEVEHPHAQGSTSTPMAELDVGDAWSNPKSSNDSNGIRPFCPHSYYQQQYELAMLCGASPVPAAERFCGVYVGEVDRPRANRMRQGEFEDLVIRQQRQKAKRERRTTRHRLVSLLALKGVPRVMLWVYEDAIDVTGSGTCPPGAPGGSLAHYAPYLRDGTVSFFTRFVPFALLLPFAIVQCFVCAYHYLPVLLCIKGCVCGPAQSALYIFTYGLLFYVPQAMLSPILFAMLAHGAPVSEKELRGLQTYASGPPPVGYHGASSRTIGPKRHGQPPGTGVEFFRVVCSAVAPPVRTADSCAPPRDEHSRKTRFFYHLYYDSSPALSLVMPEPGGSRRTPSRLLKARRDSDNVQQEGSKDCNVDHMTPALDTTGDARNRPTVVPIRYCVPMDMGGDDAGSEHTRSGETIGEDGRVYRYGWVRKRSVPIKPGTPVAPVQGCTSTSETAPHAHPPLPDAAHSGEQDCGVAQLTVDVPHPGSCVPHSREACALGGLGSATQSPKAPSSPAPHPFEAEVGLVHASLMDVQRGQLPPVHHFLKEWKLWAVIVSRFILLACMDTQLPRIPNLPDLLWEPMRLGALAPPLFVYAIYCSRPADVMPFMLMDAFPFEMGFIFSSVNSREMPSLAVAFAWPTLVTLTMLMSRLITRRCVPREAPIQVKITLAMCLTSMSMCYVHGIALFMSIYRQYAVLLVLLPQIIAIEVILGVPQPRQALLCISNAILTLLNRRFRLAQRAPVTACIVRIEERVRWVGLLFSTLALAPTFQFLQWPQGGTRTDCHGVVSHTSLYQTVHRSVGELLATQLAATALPGLGTSQVQNTTNGTRDSSSLPDVAAEELATYSLGTWQSYMVLIAVFAVAHLTVLALGATRGRFAAPIFPWDRSLLVLVGCYIMRITPSVIAVTPMWRYSVT